jgi:ACR3 family arsenite transporter
MSKWPTDKSSPDGDTTAPPSVVPDDIMPDKVSAFKGLGWLDRFLAVWIILAMAIGKQIKQTIYEIDRLTIDSGILLGNFVPSTGPALEKGQFVGVSAPIGEYRLVQQKA